MLPNLSNDITETLTINNETLIIRPWKTKDERNYMIKQSLNEDKKKQVSKEILIVDELIKPCIISGDIEKLSGEGLKRLILEMKIISNGNEVEGVSFKCNSCEKPNEVTINLSDSVTYSKGCTDFVELTKDLNVSFKTIPFREFFKLGDKNEPEFEYILNSVDKIEYKDEIFDEFTKDELKNFIDDLDLKTYKALVEAMITNREVTEIKSEQNCMHCNSVNKLDFTEDKSFF